MSATAPNPAFDRDRLTFDTLREVLPIHSFDHFERFNIILQSIESHEDGFIANVEFELTIPIPTPETGYDESALPPEMRGFWEITSLVDNLGNTYAARMGGGHGGGGGDEGFRLRFTYVVAPGLHSEATSLTFTYHLMSPRRPILNDDGQHVLSEPEILDGPWQITTPLSADGTDNQGRPIPIGQRLANEDASITVLSLERAPASFQVNARLDWTAATGSMPETRWTATDDLGNTYRTNNCAGGGGHYNPDEQGQPHAHSWRMQCIFARPIHPDATQLTLRPDRVDFRCAVWDESDPSAEVGWLSQGEVSGFGEVVIDLT